MQLNENATINFSVPHDARRCDKNQGSTRGCFIHSPTVWGLSFCCLAVFEFWPNSLQPGSATSSSRQPASSAAPNERREGNIIGM